MLFACDGLVGFTALRNGGQVNGFFFHLRFGSSVLADQPFIHIRQRPRAAIFRIGQQPRHYRGAAQLAARTAVTEGAETAPAVVEVGRRLGVDLPICEVVLDMIEGRLDAKAAVDRLLNRPMKEEA